MKPYGCSRQSCTSLEPGLLVSEEETGETQSSVETSMGTGVGEREHASQASKATARRLQEVEVTVGLETKSSVRRTGGSKGVEDIYIYIFSYLSPSLYRYNIYYIYLYDIYSIIIYIIINVSII